MEVLNFFESKGRNGGLMALVLGIIDLGVGFALWDRFVVPEVGFFSPRGLAIGLVFLATGTVLCAYGMRLIWKGQATPPRPPAAGPKQRAALAQVLETKPPPFFVCVHCAKDWGTECAGFCPDCGSIADCVEVREEADRGLVIAALG